VLLSWLSYRAVRDALANEFRTRLTSVAGTLASQVSADDIDDARRLGDEGVGYGNLQVLLEELRATSGVTNATVLDTAGIVIYDCLEPVRQRQPSPLAESFAEELSRAQHGATEVTPPRASGTRLVQYALAPVLRETGGVAGVVTVESQVDYLPALGNFRRSLALITAVLVAAMGVFAVLLARAAWSAARLEQRLSRSENLVAMGRLTATLAHEIKNPLAIIRGSAERLGKLEPEAERMNRFVVEEVDRLNRTVNRYLDFARSATEAPEGRGDAAAALDATLDLLEGELAARKIEVVRPPAADTAPVRLDPESLKQVFLNLILNAADAMPEGGRLSIARRDAGSHVELEISDTGRGIPKDVLARLGNPFYTTKAQGSGLGLFLSRRLVESGGGTLSISSETGRGTTCVVRLPRRRD
jgi:signal transduction histidine kinase